MNRPYTGRWALPPTVRSNPDRIRVARHEASHAIAALACGGRATRIWFTLNGGCAETECSDPWHRCIIAASGPASDQHFGWRRSTSDDPNIVAYARGVDSDNPEIAWDAAAKAACETIKRHEDAILYLARHLFDSPNGEMSEQEILFLTARFRPFGPVPDPPIPARLRRLFARWSLEKPADADLVYVRTDGYLIPPRQKRAADNKLIVWGAGGLIVGHLIELPSGRFRAYDLNGRSLGIFEDSTAGSKALARAG